MVSSMRNSAIGLVASWILPALCLLGLAGMPAWASTALPRPAELQSDVDFWIRVYTEVDTRAGFIHDAYDISVVYETLQLQGQRRADEAFIKATKARYAKILERLADNRQPLSHEEQRVLALWGSSSSAEVLREAADNLRFQRGQSDRFKEGLARSGEWYSHIEEVLEQKNLPSELAALPHVESSFNPEAYSSAGAAGIWQFTRSTGRSYLNIDYVVDERMDPFAATDAAARLLQHNYDLTDSWPLAITAYNHGTTGVRRAVRQLGTTDIATILRHYKGRSFGFASRNFYLSFLAAVEVTNNPARYFPAYIANQPVDYELLVMEDYLLVDSFARAFDTDLNELKRHNRALLDPVWLGKKRIPQGFTMRVPADSATGDAAQLLAAIPADQRYQQQTPDLFHKVVSGDTVSDIATRYGHSIREVAAMNSLNKRYQIRIGQVLRLPLLPN